ncbi:hypothetical protein HDU85_004854 [Gaertneriomyces sp. JEL0708]|nr:hypothetical protein HDU85_004854 [Gaertneriomyces sp. JEL0708]
MMVNDGDKLKEGLSHMAEGEKAINKKSFFGKAKPDWDVASQCFQDAANAFRSAKAYDLAINAFSQLAESHRQLSSLFLAAKALETAATIAEQQMRKPQDAAELYKRTSEFYQAQGSGDRAAEALEKAARALEETDPQRCLEYYEEACAMYEEENKMRFGADCFKKAIGVCLRKKRYDKALQLSHRLCDAFIKINQIPNFCKQALSTVIILLAMGDLQGARQSSDTFSGTAGFGQSAEGNIARAILDAMDTGDKKLLTESLKRPQAQFLDNEIMRLGSELAASLREYVPTKELPQPPAPAASEGFKQLQDEIEEEGGFL